MRAFHIEAPESENLFADQEIQRCPFLRNINEPTNFSFSSNTDFPLPVSSPTFTVRSCCLLLGYISFIFPYFLLYCIRCVVSKAQFLKMVPILTWHSGFSMEGMELCPFRGNHLHWTRTWGLSLLFNLILWLQKQHPLVFQLSDLVDLSALIFSRTSGRNKRTLQRKSPLPR